MFRLYLDIWYVSPQKHPINATTGRPYCLVRHRWWQLKNTLYASLMSSKIEVDIRPHITITTSLYCPAKEASHSHAVNNKYAKKKTPRTVVVWSTHSQKINYTRKAAEQTPLSFRNETQAVYRDVRITSNVSTRWPAETFFCFFSPSRSHGLLFSLAQADITCSVSTVSAASNGNSMSQRFTAHWGWYKQCAHFWEPFISLDAFSMRKWKLLPR